MKDINVVVKFSLQKMSKMGWKLLFWTIFQKLQKLAQMLKKLQHLSWENYRNWRNKSRNLRTVPLRSAMFQPDFHLYFLLFRLQFENKLKLNHLTQLPIHIRCKIKLINTSFEVGYTPKTLALSISITILPFPLISLSPSTFLPPSTTQ